MKANSEAHHKKTSSITAPPSMPHQ